MDTRACWSGWSLEAEMALPFHYDEEQLEEMMDRYAAMLSPTSASPFSLEGKQERQAQYGTICLWRTRVLVSAAAHIQVIGLENNELPETARLYWNGQYMEESAQPLTLYPGSHCLSLLLYSPKPEEEQESSDPDSGEERLSFQLEDADYDPGEGELLFLLQDEEGPLPLAPDAANLRFSLHDMDTLSEYIEAAVSPDGKWAAIITRHTDLEQDQYNYPIGIYRVTSAGLKLHRSLSVREPHTLRFSADSRRLAFIAVASEGYWDMIICLELANGRERILISGLHHAGQLAWHPQRDELFFVCDDHDGPEEYRVLHIRELPQRLPWWRPQKVIGRLLLNQLMPGGEVLLQRISPKMYDIQHLHVHGEYLYYVEEQRGSSIHPALLLHRLNLLSGTDKMQQLPNAIITGMQLSPSGQQLAYIGSRWQGEAGEEKKKRADRNSANSSEESDAQAAPSAADPAVIGSEAAYGYGINIYDLRTHILQLADGSIQQLDHPSPAQSGTPVGIARLNQELAWVGEDHLRYVITAGSITGIADCHGIAEGQLQYGIRLDTGASRLHSFTAAGEALAVHSEYGHPYKPAWYAQNPIHPAADTEKKWNTLALHADSSLLAEGSLAYRWAGYQPIARQSSERESEGSIEKARMWIAWPEQSAAAEQSSIPLVVYLYGGASPLLQGFDPLHQCLVTHGMAVLVLNPLGAAGYGTSSADRHVNDWGREAVGEISEMLEEVLERYPVLNRRAAGIYGGSYGGFLSYLLAARTSWFSAVCTIGGISNITSYWGSSQVGYLYGLSALSGSYPWSHPELYVQQSPLFYSQHIQAPVLMLHGEQDRNVPVGESEQLFTALRMQGKTAEMMIFANEQHAIRSKPRAYGASQKYIVAWFEKYLNRNPQLWEELTGSEIEITLD
ncbi:S9 family peptidase [Paenibacillus sp. Z6-24]